MKIARGCLALLLLFAGCGGAENDSACSGGCGSPHPIDVAGGMSVAETGSATLVYPSGDVSLGNGSYVRSAEAFTFEDDGDSFALVRPVPADPSPREMILWIEPVEGAPHVVLCNDLQEVLSRSGPGEPWVCTNQDVSSSARIEPATVTAIRTPAAKGGSTLSLFVSTASGIRVSVTVVKTYTERHLDPNCY